MDSTLLENPCISNEFLANVEKQRQTTEQKTDYRSMSLATLPNAVKAKRSSSNRTSLEPVKLDAETADDRGHSSRKLTASSSDKSFIALNSTSAGKMRKPRLSLSLQTNDIEGASPRNRESRRSDPRNPLCPEYDWPQSRKVEIVPPRFIRDPLFCKDIMGEKKRQLFASPGNEREFVKWSSSDLEQAHKHAGGAERSGRRPKEPVEERKRLPFDFSKSSRCTNPLTPEYRYNIPHQADFSANHSQGVAVTDEMRKNWTIGKIDNARSSRFYMGPVFHDTPGRRGDITYREYMLRNEDVEGSQPGSLGKFSSRVTPFTPKQYRTTNYIGDIQGSSPRVRTVKRS
uniref:Uncharacterized protein n=1 Tax=Guillardia theta TaxID=55529 RepID=A0A7S4PCQ0_GUITH|mmetsp:Transcript_47978/g.150550  ORF Transcript_47978/g.150550 Transcript_47978/m.150550 type:complete len:344 (+) Transcript_47978:830-1861(+)